MKEAKIDLWEAQADLRLITTNGYRRRSDGAAVMGRGCAAEAKRKLPGIEHTLGEAIRRHGNRPMRLKKLSDGSHLGTFPVKHNWNEKADVELITDSAAKLVEMADRFGYSRIFLPRPGCGNGGLKWEEVRPILEGILDSRFTTVSK